jgi:hypothetical protein
VRINDGVRRHGLRHLLQRLLTAGNLREQRLRRQRDRRVGRRALDRAEPATARLGHDQVEYGVDRRL